MPVVPVANSMYGYNFTGDIEEEKIDFYTQFTYPGASRPKPKKKIWQ